MRVLEASQEYPYKLMKRKIMHSLQYREYLNILLKNLPNSDSNEIVDIFKSLDHQGCSCAAFANALGYFILESGMSDETFRKLFGFSIISKEKDCIDFNKLMLDVYTKLYNVASFKIVQYREYTFASASEAVRKLFGKKISDNREAVLYLFDNDIVADGYDGELLKYKDGAPSVSNYVGTCEEVGRLHFDVPVSSMSQLSVLCDKNKAVLSVDCEKIYQKFSGLTADNFNFWSKYYSNITGLDFYLGRESDETLTLEDLNRNTITNDKFFVNVGPDVDVYMHTDKMLSWMKPSSKEAGHMMYYKGLNADNDILVSSYGEEYIIPSEYLPRITFSRTSVRNVVDVLDCEDEINASK